MYVGAPTAGAHRLALLHPLPSLATTAAAVVFGLLFGLRPSDSRLWLLAVVMLLAQFSISALNDWADRERDASAGRTRPIPAGLVSPPQALIIAGVCAFLSVALAARIGPLPGGLAVVGIAAGWFYDVSLKPTPLSFLPFAVAFPLLPLWAAAIAGRLGSWSVWLVLAGVPLAAAIHLGDAIPDREIDASAGARTLAVALGKPGAEIAATIALAAGSTVLGTALAREWPVLAVAIALAGWIGGLGYLWLARSAGGTVGLRRAKWVLVAGALLSGGAWLAAKAAA